jgi:predicted TIM-barrel fold metal-dependent hydrolase
MDALPGIADCHFHVIAPLAASPMLPTRSYTPEPASLAGWQQALGPRGVTRGVVVQPSVYGSDNRVLLGALAEGAGRLKGVAAVTPGVHDAELDRLAAAGVRGVRMAHFEAGDPRALGGFVPLAAFDALEPRLQAHGLHLQLFTDSRLLPAIAERLRRSRVPVVIDHMGRAPAALGTRHEGFRTLLQLMVDGPVWVKLSGVANVSDLSPDHDDARLLHQALLQAAPRRVLWGSDWPHTRPQARAGQDAPDTRHLLDLARAWTPSAHHADLFWRNASALYGFESPAVPPSA